MTVRRDSRFYRGVRVLAFAAFTVAVASVPFLHVCCGAFHPHDHDARTGAKPAHTH